VIAGTVTVAVLVAAVLAFVIADRGDAAVVAADRDRGIVGAWYVDTVGAPFAPHAMIFHSDGTVQITNPDAAEKTNSSSAGYGAWKATRGGFEGQFLEVNADKTTNLFTTNLMVTFRVVVHGDRFDGPAAATYYNRDGQPVQGPFPATLKGQRITTDSGAPVVSRT
jgi:hypothetical protein